MRLISAGSLVRVQSGPPKRRYNFRICILKCVQILKFFENCICKGKTVNRRDTGRICERFLTELSNTSTPISKFVIKLVRAEGECLGSKRR